MGSGNNEKNQFWFVFWLLILIFLAFEVALFCAGWYILLGPLSACLPSLKTARLIAMGSGNGGNPVWFVFWLLVLIFLGFWVGFFCAGWYVLLAPLAVCLPVLKGLTDILMQGVQFPVFCAESMMSMKSLF